MGKRPKTVGYIVLWDRIPMGLNVDGTLHIATVYYGTYMFCSRTDANEAIRATKAYRTKYRLASAADLKYKIVRLVSRANV